MGIRPVSCAITWARRTTVRGSTTPTRRCGGRGRERRIEGFVQRAAEVVGAAAQGCATGFAAAMNDDLNTSAALAVVHDTVREATRPWRVGRDGVRAALTAVRAMSGFLVLTAGRVLGRRRPRGRPQAVVDSLVSWHWSSGPGRTRRTGRPPIGARPAQERGSSGGGHSDRAALDGRRAALMPGNSTNRTRRVTSKKGASAGSGGKNRAGLKGRGKTLPADERPWHKGYSGTEDLPAKTARKQDKERRAAAAEGRAPKIGQQGSKDTTLGRGGGRGNAGGRSACAESFRTAVARGSHRDAVHPTREGPELLLGRNPVTRRCAPPCRHRALHGAGHRHRRADHTNRPDGRRPRHPDLGSGRNELTGDRRRPAQASACRCRRFAYEPSRHDRRVAERPRRVRAGGPGRRDRPAQRRRGDPVGGRVRRARRLHDRAAGAGITTPRRPGGPAPARRPGPVSQVST